MKRKWMLAAMAVPVAVALAAAPAQAGTALYVSGGHGNNVVFKVEDGRPYVLAVDARSYCRGTGAHSDERQAEFTLERFRGPVRMRQTPEGLRAADLTYTYYRNESAIVRARFHRGAIVGTFVARYDEKDFQCQSRSYFGSPKVRFKAVRYVRVGAAAARNPGGHTRAGGIYFTNAGSIEVLLRRVSPKAVEVRGATAQRCALPASEWHPPRVPLFAELADTIIGDRDRFRDHSHRFGPARKHTTFDERATVSRRLRARFATGRYWRVKVKKRDERIVRRCKTASVRFRAVRYVPAA
jgi:hypothetical protein